MMIGGNNQVTTQNEGGGGGSNKGGKEGGLTLKKGPWTAAEDAVLAEYVRTHGEGNWNAVQKNTGLARCGKSCRLRWANHLRPNLKKGAFSAEEERIIIELHAMMGNKWARMASRLPGRTDNEIKNYWNTRVKRRQRQGLPLYPPDIQSFYNSQHHSQPFVPTTTTSSFSFQNPTTTPLHSCPMLTAPSPHHVITSSAPQQLLQYDPHSAATPPPPLYSPSPASTPPPSTPPSLPSPSLSTPPHVSPLRSPHNHPSSTLPLVDSFNSTSGFYFPRPLPSLENPHRRKRFKHDDGSESNYKDHKIAVNCSSNGSSSFMVPFPPFNPHAVTVTTTSLTPQQHYPSYSFDPTILNLASSPTILYPHFDSRQFISTSGFDYQSKTELPSNQFFSQDGNLSEVNNNHSSNDHNNNHHSLSLSFSDNGLLEDMLEEAQVLAGNNEIMGTQSCFVGSSSSAEGLASVSKAKEETAEQMNTAAAAATATNEDYSNVIPSSMSAPEWYIDSGGEGSNGQSSAVSDDNLGFELHQIASLFPVDDIADDHDRAPTSRSWDNFPGNC